MKALIFNVGPLSNDYFGVHTYSDVLMPLINALKIKEDIHFTWAGIQLESHLKNAYLEREKIEMTEGDYMTLCVDKMQKSWDLLDISEFSFFFCQPRPLTNKIENEILLTLIDKFLDAGKPVFVWEQDLFIAVDSDGFKQKAVESNFTQRMKDNVILLHPAILPPVGFKNTHFFPFSMFEWGNKQWPERKDDFVFIGNVYSRQDQAVRFFGKLNDAPFNKAVYGDWTKDAKRAEFASQFTNFEFRGSTEHWAAIPLLKRAKATLHIVPEFAEPRGLMTARTFTSQMAKCICFVDKKIYGAEMFYPDILIVENGDDIKDRWDFVMGRYKDIILSRQRLMEEYTIENRVKELMTVIFPRYGLKSS